MFRSLLKLLFILLFSLFVIFAVLYSFEEDSILVKYGSNPAAGYLRWLSSFVTYQWGEIYGTGQNLVAFQTDSQSVGILRYLLSTMLYGFLGLFLALSVCTILTYFSVFRNIAMTKLLSGILSFVSGFHIIILCFLIKILLRHSEGFHVLIIVAIALGSNMFSDIHQYQHDQFRKLMNSDFIIAARACGDSILRHARRSIAIGVFSQWNSLVGTMFTSTIIVEYFFKVRGIGYALRQYLIEPNLRYPTLRVESEFFMLVSTAVIITVLLLNFVKDLGSLKLVSPKK